MGAGADEANATAAQISASLDEPFQFDAVSASIGSSIGIALASTAVADSHGLMTCADVAMYRAKLQATRFALYETALDGVGSKLGLADELSAAIDGDELLLHYQPQLDLRSGEVATVEALVRWRHPERGLIQPLTFLPLAEEAGLMGRPTRLVLAQALEQCAAWHAAGRRMRVSVNIRVGDLPRPEADAQRTRRPESNTSLSRLTDLRPTRSAATRKLRRFFETSASDRVTEHPTRLRHTGR